jgi:UDP-N-acetylglucosamine 2-epimerase (non-hydrolysing)/UDP-GlcNAc3NAcA epimerase
MRIVTVVGNRPQFVKAAAVSHRLRRDHDEILIHTGQHYDDELSRIFFDELGIPRPARELRLGTGSNAAQTGRMIGAVEEEIGAASPDLVLVYGDTNTTLAAAIAAGQSRVPLAHVEAGMRSFDRSMPEEFNRVLTDHASDLLLCSTEAAVTNLRHEGITDGVELVGDVMADVVLDFLPLAEARSTVLEDHGLAPGRYVVVTAHRAGNVDDAGRLERLVSLLEAVPVPCFFPVHPRTRARLAAAGLDARLDRARHVIVASPVGYLDMLKLTAHAHAVLTDSGGLQKEACVLRTPCVTMRDTTEWVETVELGWNVLVDLDAEKAVAALESAQRPDAGDPYGGGTAGERACAAIDALAGRPVAGASAA